ncbi:EAL domain-containing protein [Marinobacter sp. ATCH36]|uniref:bifunctional diguanylate cyclase/phosphodiesterase n=1 Tax=Marinobacter sp. ATCH36 TaxID=2945106 RepID=UPI002021CCF6|nr:EAL domain-containing protein [Marinobacter sp. ATCH36]MCL7942741.1 EAL domain-containing protein [Marinobacter sp. ATCH36]
MPGQYPRRPTYWKNPSSRQSVMWLLGLLILVFVAGMLLLSRLNLNYSRDALSELRRQQIHEVVSAGLMRINARQSALASYTKTLANVGESFHSIAQGGNPEINESALRNRLENSLKDHLRDFEGAAGGGLWFEPGVMSEPDTGYMPYFILNSGEPGLERLDVEGRLRNFRNALWFSRTLGPKWTPSPDNAGEVYWSPIYYDLNTERAVLTLASPMYDRQNNLLGMATTAWTADQIIDVVSRITVTEHSFTFLNDRNNRNLSSLSKGEDTREEQALIDAILALELAGDTGARFGPKALATRKLTVGEDDYELYYAATAGGMVYGAGVPVDEINAVLRPMEQTNQRILVGTVSAMLLLSLYLLYRIIQLIRELQASYTDELTGLPNRVRLLRDLQTRDDISLLIINLDRFNEINSLFGNDCGDQVLLSIATRLTDFNNEKDRDQLRVYRLPGDEFAILAPCLEAQPIHELAAQLRQLVNGERIYWQQQPLTLDVTIGMAVRRDRKSGDSADQLVSQAKVAVLQAREQNRHHLLYDPAVGVEENYEANLYWANRLKAAIDDDRLVPWFQPIYDNEQQRVTKYECLVRMVELDGRLVGAGQFVKIADRLRLNRRITVLMIEKCFARFSDRNEEFSINLSYGDIADPETVSKILEALDHYGIGNRVIFEILESDGITNYDEIHHFIEQVKPFGCHIAIDDFGTGYSNFAHLLSLNVDYIKIDGSLICNLHEDYTAFLVTSGIVQFARSLNIRTVAEFVHNDAVQERVRELGIDFSQGDYFGMPEALL